MKKLTEENLRLRNEELNDEGCPHFYLGVIWTVSKVIVLTQGKCIVVDVVFTG